MKRAGIPLAVLALLAVGLTLWMGPRPVFELWITEEIPAQRLLELFPDCPEGVPSPAGSVQQVLELAEANGIATAALPTLQRGAQLFDADNDGDLDLFLPASASAPAVEAKPKSRPRRFLLYQNDGTGHFQEIGDHLGEAFVDPRTGRPGSDGETTWCVDLDRNGLLDLLVSIEGKTCLCLRNRFARRHYLVVRPVPSRPLDSDSRGKTRVVVVSGGTEQVRVLDLDADDPLACPRTAHFGLGDADHVDTVIVEWPSGLRTEVHDIPVDGEEVLLEPALPEEGTSTAEKERKND